MKNSNKSIVNLLAYVTIIIVAVLIFVETLLPVVGVEISGTLFNVLRIIGNVFTLVILSISAYSFLPGKKKWVKILFIVAILIYIAGTVLIWFN